MKPRGAELVRELLLDDPELIVSMVIYTNPIYS